MRSLSKTYASYPVYAVDPLGSTHLLGNLQLLPDDGVQWTSCGEEPLTADEIPWFIADARPKGFMGRLFAINHPELGLPDRPDYWNNHQIIKAMAAATDLPSDIVVGDTAVAELSKTTFMATHKEAHFAQQLKEVTALTYAKSGVGGEQPKFTADYADPITGEHHVIVKFAPDSNVAGNESIAQRWADLLVAEHIANAVLTATGIPAAKTEIGQMNSRVYLESERFDRADQGGRIRTVSLEAHAMEFHGTLTNWWAAAKEPAYTENVQAKIRRAALFAVAIGNTDTHFGNLSLQWVNSGWDLAPIYDMTPMFWAPSSQGLHNREYQPKWPSDVKPEEKRQAIEAGVAFFDAIQKDPRVSADFKLTVGNYATQLRNALSMTETYDVH